jgi:L-threonylcarbamoyladenylate synthase
MLPRLTINQAADALCAGGVVAFPTETSYGIGCRAFDAGAVARVVAAKHRPEGKPLPVLLPGVEALRRLEPETPLLVLAEAFWPGPLTLVVPAFPGLPPAVTADMNMVGLRVPAHPVALELVREVGEPLVATSANRSGEPAAADAAACDHLVGVDGVVDGGPVPGGHNTVVGLVDGDLHLYRAGPISEAALREVWDRARLLL